MERGSQLGKCRVCRSKPWVHNSVASLMMEPNLQKGRLVYWVPCAKSRRNCNNSFRVYACCFVNMNTVTYFNLSGCPFKQRDMSVMTRVPNFIL